MSSMLLGQHMTRIGLLAAASGAFCSSLAHVPALHGPLPLCPYIYLLFQVALLQSETGSLISGFARISLIVGFHLSCPIPQFMCGAGVHKKEEVPACDGEK